MKGTNLIDLGLSAYDEMFMTDEQRAAARKPIVDEIPITELHPFRDHPFQVRMDEEMERLKQSIVQSGVLVPALARKRREGGYELISGHRRMAACREKMPRSCATKSAFWKMWPTKKPIVKSSSFIVCLPEED